MKKKERGKLKSWMKKRESQKTALQWKNNELVDIQDDDDDDDVKEVY